MKNLLRLFSILSIFALTAYAAQAQKTNDTAKNVPLDPKVIHGVLPNGMQYYIRQNATPANRAEYYIVHNVGAILEDDDQNGLAHFTEHMAFNGTKNFPDKGILDFMEKNGVAFGHNVNAFTAQDVTSYMLSKVPTTREGIIDTSLLVLHDWSGFISFENKEIDAERGVIHEEWRTRRNADFRLRNQTNAAIYNNSKYAKRDVIGDINIIDNFEYETIKRFYNEWYRPDLQAIIVIGDINPKQIEEKIKRTFADIPKRENPTKRYNIEIPDNTEPLISIATDPEAESTKVQVMFKHNLFKNKNLDYLKFGLKSQLYSNMLNNRLTELTQKENPPFIYAYNYDYEFTRTKAGSFNMAMAKKDDAAITLTTLLTENMRLKEHGFTQSELDRAKAEMLRQYEQQYNERDKKESEKYIWTYFYNFLSNEPAPGIEFEYDFAKKTLQDIQLSDVNELTKTFIPDNNMVVTITGPEKSKMPTKAEIIEIINKTQDLKTTAYQDDASSEPLMKTSPKAVKYKKMTEKNGIVTLNYANGLTVSFKSTDFKDDEILMNSYKFGGKSNLPESDIPSALMASSLISASGLGEFSSTQLGKKLSDKAVNLNLYFDDYDQGISGACAPQDFEVMLQLINLHFTAPRKDAIAAKAYMQRMEAYIENRGINPASRFSDTISQTMVNYHPRRPIVNKELLQKVDYDKVFDIYTDRFSDANDYNFFFVGNLDKEATIKLCNTYLGSLPTKGGKGAYVNEHVTPPAGVVEKKVTMELEEPKSTVYINFNGTYKYSTKANFELKALEHILGLRYTETIREEEGGSYGVSVRATETKIPENRYNMRMYFDCSPDDVDKLTAIVYREIDIIKKDGPTQEDFQKTIEYFKKTRQEKLKENNYWLNVLVKKSYEGVDLSENKNYEDIVNSLSIESIKKAADTYLNAEQRVQIIMIPK